METSVYCARGRLGQSVFAAHNLRAGEEILEFSGPIITFEQTLAKGEHQADPVQIGHDAYLDIGEPARSLNHSCNPNSGVREDVKLAAFRDIRRDEEIKFDYSTTMDEDYWTMVCRCGYEACRGVVKDFKYMPPETQQKYLQLSAVQRFITNQFNSTPAYRNPIEPKQI